MRDSAVHLVLGAAFILGAIATAFVYAAAAAIGRRHDACITKSGSH